MGFLTGAAAGAAVTIVISAVDKFSNVFAGVNKGMLAVGAGITALGIAGLAASKGFINTAASFETAFVGVKKTVELTESEFERLRQSFKNLSKEIPVTFEELSSIGEIAGQLGVEGVENLEKFTKTIADISATTNLTAEDAATSFARIANIMQEPIENVDKMGSVVVDLGNNFATTEGEISTFAQRIAGAGNIAGLTTQDILAIGAAFSSVGVQAEAGGTAVQKMLINMNTAATANGESIIDNTILIEEETIVLNDLENQLMLATLRQSEFTETTKESTRVSSQLKIDEITQKIRTQTEAIEILSDAHGKMSEDGGAKLRIFAETAGMTSTEFQKAWKDDAGKAFALFIKGLGEQGDRAIGTLSELGLEDQRLVRSFLSLSNAGDLVTDTFEVANEAWIANTALVIEAEKRYASTDSQVTILKNKFSSLKDDMGRTLIPAFISLVDILGKVIGWLEKHPTLTKYAVAALAIGSALMIVVGPVLMLIALLPLLAAGIGMIGAAFTVAALPIIAIVALVVGLIASIVLLGIAIAELWRRWKGEEKQSKEDAIDEFDRMNKQNKYAEAKMDEEVFKSKTSGKSYVKDVDEKGITRYKEVASTNNDPIKLGFDDNAIRLNDFILTPSGKIIKPSPQDTIIGTKNPESLGGGVNINIENVYGLDSEQISESIAQEIKRTIRL